MDRELVFAAVADERRQMATLLDDLNDTQLSTPSLCAGWDIKTVGAHLLSVCTDSFWTFQGMALRRGSLDRAIDELARRRAQLPATRIAAALRCHADRRVSPPVFGPLDPLADILVHGGDIRIPLGMAFNPDRERAALALDFLTKPWRFGFVPIGFLCGIRLCAIDIDRSWGTGAEIRGPVAALMMTVCGRSALLHQLEGPGLQPLHDRLARR
ncbi:maleylpyruvate isomerase family mycothiol-dependent enzyme [Mycobacterium noviomagense]|uniref:maleylpyruvate isomerase family mycothiol-dependent enzyme n=1 Tax=Mycobacterium noviomagense TaxID=459858 RepID=UPI0009F3C475|nr:maleylpyruvate isomerase family mycothiol-dependent enzyme [Mycobacterium noviomagense]